MSSIVSTIIEVVLKLIGWSLDKSKMNKEQKIAFLNFINSYNEAGNSSIKLGEDAKKQFEELKKSSNIK